MNKSNSSRYKIKRLEGANAMGSLESISNESV